MYVSGICSDFLFWKILENCKAQTVMRYSPQYHFHRVPINEIFELSIRPENE